MKPTILPFLLLSLILTVSSFLSVLPLSNSQEPSNDNRNSGYSTIGTYVQTKFWDFLVGSDDAYLTVEVEEINETILELTLRAIDIDSVPKGYKWHMALCNYGNITEVYYMEEDRQGGFNYSTWIPLNYDRLIYYGLPETWGANATETGYGWILFSSGSTKRLPEHFRLQIIADQTAQFKLFYGTETGILVGTSTSNMATSESFQRLTFYDKGRFWVWYSNGSNLLFKTSTDGQVWSNETDVRGCPAGRMFSITFDETYVHYAYSQGSNKKAMYYRRGAPEQNGTITWSAAEQIAIPATKNIAYFSHTIAVDSDGYPFIGYIERVYERGFGYTFSSVVTKSSQNDGTWATDSGFPYPLSGWQTDSTVVVALNETRMYAMAQGMAVVGRLWNGTAWSNEEAVSTSPVYTYAPATTDGDDIYVTYQNDKYVILLVKRTYGVGWGSEVEVQDSVDGYSFPVISLQTTSQLTNFWAESMGALDYIYYKNVTDMIPDTSPTLWINETTEQITYGNRLSGSYQSYENTISLVYMTGTSSPYNIKHAYLTVTVAAPAPQMVYVIFIILMVTFICGTTLLLSEEF